MMFIGYTFSSLITVSTLIISALGHLDIRFRLQIKSLPPSCAADPELLEQPKRCSVPYFLNLLSSKNADFDLIADMMQDGKARRLSGGHRNIFADSTVLRISQRTQIQKGDHLFAGLKLFDVPESVQDYYVMDLTKVVAGLQLGSTISVSGDDFIFSAKIRNLRPVHKFAMNGCSCAKQSCSCCETLDIPKLTINDTGCVVVKYLPVEKGFDVKFTLNDVVMFEREISVRNPPPVCFQIPYLKDYASICVHFHNITEEAEVLSACVGVEAELYHVRLYEHEFGCFRIPLSIQEQNQHQQLLAQAILQELKKGITQKK